MGKRQSLPGMEAIYDLAKELEQCQKRITDCEEWLVFLDKTDPAVLGPNNQFRPFVAGSARRGYHTRKWAPTKPNTEDQIKEDKAFIANNANVQVIYDDDDAAIILHRK